MRKILSILLILSTAFMLLAAPYSKVQVKRLEVKEQAGTPAINPDEGYQMPYPKTGGFWYVLDSSGVETALMFRAASLTPDNILISGANGQAADSGKAFNDSGTTTNDIWTAGKVISYFVWGNIGGILSNQSDLQNALDAKQDVLGYTAEDSANKATDFSVLDNTLYPTTQAIATYIGTLGYGDMLKSVYDPANIIEQLVGLTATQTLTNKTLTTPIFTNSATKGAYNLTARSTAPSAPSPGDIYLDNGTNTASGSTGLRHYTGAAWEDISGAGGGGGLTFTAITTDTNAVSGKFYIINASSGTVTLTLPASPSVDYKIGYYVLNADNTVTISRNGNNIKAAAADLTPGAGVSEVLAWSGNATQGWFTAYDKTSIVPDYEFSEASPEFVPPGILTISGTKTIAHAVDNNGKMIPFVDEVTYGASTTVIDFTSIRADLGGALTGTWKIKFAQGYGAGSGGGGGATAFTELTDTPSSFSGQSGKYIKVNSGETALEFTDPPSGGGGGTPILSAIDGQSFRYPSTSITNPFSYAANSSAITIDVDNYADYTFLWDAPATAADVQPVQLPNFTIPTGCTSLKFRIVHVGETGNSYSSETVVFKGEWKNMTDNTAWSSATAFTIGTDTLPSSGSAPQKYESTVTLATLGLAVGDVVQMVIFVDNTSTWAHKTGCQLIEVEVVQ